MNIEATVIMIPMYRGQNRKEKSHRRNPHTRPKTKEKRMSRNAKSTRLRREL